MSENINHTLLTREGIMWLRTPHDSLDLCFLCIMRYLQRNLHSVYYMSL